VLAFIEITLIWHEKYTKNPTKRHYRDNIEYCDILTHDNHHQLFLVSPNPTQVYAKYHIPCSNSLMWSPENTPLPHFVHYFESKVGKGDIFECSISLV